jgi:hypothetical protein
VSGAAVARTSRATASAENDVGGHSTRRDVAASVPRDMGRVARKLVEDPTVYPVDEKLGEGMLQRWIAELLRPMVERWLRTRGAIAFVGADQFIYWRQYDAHRRVAPDVYVLPGVDPATRVDAWKVWQSGIRPSFAFEVVSQDWEKDYVVAPELYAELGAGELVLYDPDWHKRPDGRRWQVFRSMRKRPLVRIEDSTGDRVRSRALGCWLRAVGRGEAQRVRLATGPRGAVLLPTPDEAERHAREAEQRAREAEQQARRRAETAEDEVARLRAELERLKKRR